MNNNNLKRRRPFGQDNSPVEPVLQYSSQYSPPTTNDLAWASLPVDLQHQVFQAATIYGITAQRLHELALLEQSHQDPRKRQRLTADPAMAPHYSTGYSSNLQEKTSGGGFAQALEAFKLSICQQCCRSYDPHESYQPVPNTEVYGYGSTKPYVAERAPSVSATTANPYASSSVAQSPEATLACSSNNAGFMGAYMDSYQPLDAAPAMTAQPTGRENMVYPCTTPAASYFNSQPPEASTPAVSEAPRVMPGAPFVSDQVMPAVSASMRPFGSDTDLALAMAGPQSLHSVGSMPASTPPEYGMMQGYPHATNFNHVSHGVFPHPAMSAAVTVADPNMAMAGNMSTGSRPRGKSKGHAGEMNVVFPNQKRPPVRRGPFQDPAHREETAQTRRIGSCMRCRMQRIRCKINTKDETGPCETCTGVTGKVWRFPCIRRKLVDVKCFKPGQVQGFEWTRRWKDNIVDNIASWASLEDKIIQISEGYTTRYMELRVRKFIPQDGDKLERTWVHQGVKRSVPIPPYAIVDLDAASKSYQDYINRGVVECFDKVLGPPDGILWETYCLAWEVAQKDSTPSDERALLILCLRLWMSVRLSTRSAIIVGQETLGMSKDILDETSPNHGNIPLPPVMGAQLDMVLIHQIQGKLRGEMLEQLSKMTQANKPKTWLTVYLVMFILLHNVSLLSKHDAGYARKHGIQRRFAREKDVEEYHLGAHILLAYFHYCNKNVYPFSQQCTDQELRTLAELDDQQVRFVKISRLHVAQHKHEWEQIRREGQFEDDFYFVSQLYEEQWQPPAGM